MKGEKEGRIPLSNSKGAGKKKIHGWFGDRAASFYFATSDEMNTKE